MSVDGIIIERVVDLPQEDTSENIGKVFEEKLEEKIEKKLENVLEHVLEEKLEKKWDAIEGKVHKIEEKTDANEHEIHELMEKNKGEKGKAETKETQAEVQHKKGKHGEHEEHEGPSDEKKTRKGKKQVDVEPIQHETTTRSGREIKAVERFEIEESKKERQHIEISEGKGQPLGEIESIRVQIDKRKGEDELLKKFYTILFHKPGKTTHVKNNLKHFQGLAYVDQEKRDKEIASLMTRFDKWVKDELKELCEILDLDKKGSKEALIERIVDFLELPFTHKTETGAQQQSEHAPKKRRLSHQAEEGHKPGEHGKHEEHEESHSSKKKTTEGATKKSAVHFD